MRDLGLDDWRCCGKEDFVIFFPIWDTWFITRYKYSTDGVHNITRFEYMARVRSIVARAQASAPSRHRDSSRASWDQRPRTPPRLRHPHPNPDRPDRPRTPLAPLSSSDYCRVSWAGDLQSPPNDPVRSQDENPIQK